MKHISYNLNNEECLKKSFFGAYLFSPMHNVFFIETQRAMVVSIDFSFFLLVGLQFGSFLSRPNQVAKSIGR